MSAARKAVPPANPGGKPGRWRGAKMVDYIATATQDGQLMASYFVRVLKGIEKGANVVNKMKAAEWLADRFAGKAVEVALTGDVDSASNPLAELDADQLRALIHKIVRPQNSTKPPDARAAAGATPTPPDMSDVAKPAETSGLSAPKPTATDTDG